MHQRVNLYDQISSNKLKSYALVLFFIAVIVFLGVVFSALFNYGAAGVVFAFLLAIFMSVFSFYYSDSIVLAASGAKEAERKYYAHLHNTVEGLAIAAGIPKPRVYVINDAAINAFATGRDPQHAVVAVTTGALEKFTRQELEGVLAHELSHVKNYDVRYMAMVAVLVGVIALLSDWLLRSTLFGGRGRNSKVPPWLIIAGIALAILTPIIAQLVKLAVSRKREFLADADGALLSRNPEGLASALAKIKSDKHQLSSANHATAHLYFSNPLRAEWLSGLFSTHPPIDERIAALKAAS